MVSRTTSTYTHTHTHFKYINIIQNSFSFVLWFRVERTFHCLHFFLTHNGSCVGCVGMCDDLLKWAGKWVVGIYKRKGVWSGACWCGWVRTTLCFVRHCEHIKWHLKWFLILQNKCSDCLFMTHIFFIKIVLASPVVLKANIMSALISHLLESENKYL